MNGDGPTPESTAHEAPSRTAPGEERVGTDSPAVPKDVTQLGTPLRLEIPIVSANAPRPTAAPTVPPSRRAAPTVPPGPTLTPSIRAAAVPPSPTVPPSLRAAPSARTRPSYGPGSYTPPSDPKPSTPPEFGAEDFLFHLHRGSALLDTDHVHEARESLERALSLRPRDARSQDALAVVYFRLGLYPLAIAIYEKLIAEAPAVPSFRVNLALAHFKTGHLERARDLLRDVVSREPGHVRANRYLGLLEERLGQFERAREAWEAAGEVERASRARARSLVPPALSYAPPSLPSAPRAALAELAGQDLSFSVADPSSERGDERTPWRAVELGREPREDDSPRSLRPADLPEGAFVSTLSQPLQTTARRTIGPASLPERPVPRDEPTVLGTWASIGEAHEDFSEPVVAKAPPMPRIETAPYRPGGAAAYSEEHRYVGSTSPRPTSRPPRLEDGADARASRRPDGSGAVEIRGEVARFLYVAGAVVRADAALAYPAESFRHFRSEEPGADACIAHAVLEGDGELVVGGRGGDRLLVRIGHAGVRAWVRTSTLLAFDGEEHPPAVPLAAGYVARGGATTLLEAPGPVLVHPFEAPIEVPLAGVLAIVGGFEATPLPVDAKTPTPRKTLRLEGAGTVVFCARLARERLP